MQQTLYLVLRFVVLPSCAAVTIFYSTLLFTIKVYIGFSFLICHIGARQQYYLIKLVFNSYFLSMIQSLSAEIIIIIAIFSRSNSQYC